MSLCKEIISRGKYWKEVSSRPMEEKHMIFQSEFAELVESIKDRIVAVSSEEATKMIETFLLCLAEKYSEDKAEDKE